MVRSLQCSWANQNLLQLPNFSLIVFYFNSHVWHLLLTFYLQTRKFLPKPQKSESANPRFHKILHKTYLATSFSRNTISSTFALIPELGESYAERNWYFSTMSIKNFNPSLTESESSRLIIAERPRTHTYASHFQSTLTIAPPPDTRKRASQPTAPPCSYRRPFASSMNRFCINEFSVHHSSRPRTGRSTEIRIPLMKVSVDLPGRAAGSCQKIPSRISITAVVIPWDFPWDVENTTLLIIGRS